MMSQNDKIDPSLFLDRLKTYIEYDFTDEEIRESYLDIEKPDEFISNIQFDPLETDEIQQLFFRYLELLTNSNFYEKATTNIISIVLKILNRCIRKRISLTIDEFNEAHLNAISVLFTLKEEHWSSLFTLMINFSDRTTLVPILLQLDLPSYVVRWMSLNNDDRAWQEKYINSILTIAYNLARHDEGAAALIQLKAIEIIKTIPTDLDDELPLLVAMILALLTTSEQIKSDRKRMNRILDRILQTVIDASHEKDFTAKEGYHISEVLIVFVKLSVDDRTLDYVLNHAEIDEEDQSSRVCLFTDLLLRFHTHLQEQTDVLEHLTFHALVNIIWSISFQDEYKIELKTNQNLIDVLQRVAKQSTNTQFEYYTPRHLFPLQKAIDGILVNLEFKKVPNSTASINNSKKINLMISYSHADAMFCRRLMERIPMDTFDIWIDFRCCQAGDLWEAIAEGMEQAQIIISLISKDYTESKSCRQEFCYAADVLRKPIIPLIIEDYRPLGWIGIRVSTLKYIRFRQIDNNPSDQQINDLFEMIGASIESKSPVVLSPIVEVVRPSTNEIDQWFHEQQLTDELRSVFSSCRTYADLAIVADIILKDIPAAYGRCATRYSRQHNRAELGEDEFSYFVRRLHDWRSNIKAPFSSKTSTNTFNMNNDEQIDDNKRRELDAYYLKQRDQLPVCPQCQSKTHVIPVVMGRPSNDLILYANEGHVKPSGCTKHYDGWCKTCQKFI